MRTCPNCKQEIADPARFCPYCGTATPLEAQKAPGDPYVGQNVNGKFYVESLLGQGGMGRVYKATHLTLDRPVVLKMLHKTFLSDESVVQRFHREAKAASRLNHPNSIQVIDFGQAEDGTLFMAMEYLAGRDLARLLADEFPLGELRVIRIVAQILSALAEAHSKGIVHRDLKPENVMVEARRDEPDFVKVLDFGIAQIQNPAGKTEPKLTRAGLVCGTPEYMSPEQARGEDLDARSDLYSVGVILYQLATGALPFESDTPIGFVTKHLTETPLTPRERRPDLPISRALDSLVTRALSKDKNQRPPNAEQMRSELLACVNSQPEPLRPGAGLPGPRETGLGVAPTRPVPPPGDAGGGKPPEVKVDVRPEAEDPIALPKRSKAPFAVVGVAALAGVGAAVAFIAMKKPAPAPAPLEAPRPVAAAPAPAPQPAPPPEPKPEPKPEVKVAVAKSPAPPRKPDRAKALELYEQAEGARADQDADKAIRLYLEAERADPTMAQIQKKLALCFQLKGDNKRAVEHYRAYLKSNPDDADKVRAILATLR